MNPYIPFASTVKAVIPHTDIEYTFRLSYDGAVRPGQFFEVSVPKFGEAPISVSGIGEDFVDLTIRRVGVVTDEVFERYAPKATRKVVEKALRMREGPVALCTHRPVLPAVMDVRK